jgi:glycerol-3-phosphate dehydrogenase
MRIAPHIIRPLSFVMPHVTGLRPRWMLRCGLFLYDHLARRDLLPGTKSVHLHNSELGIGLQPTLKYGFKYSDAWVDDARLVVLNAMDAKQRGAQIFTRTCCEHLEARNARWHAILRPSKTQTFGAEKNDGSAPSPILEVDAACVINATGAWAADMQSKFAPTAMTQKMRLVKGSHIVVKRLFSHDSAFIFQHPDGRIVFALPYEKEFTLIGTTDVEYHDTPDQFRAAISTEEVAYLCELSNQYFERKISATDVVWSYSGVRPLVDDGRTDSKSITRDYRLELDLSLAPILHVFGGKITTYRRLAEDALAMIAAPLACVAPTWTKTAVLPGGDLFSATPDNVNVQKRQDFIQACCQQYSGLSSALVERLATTYGTRIHQILCERDKEDVLGEQVLPGLYAGEIRYLMSYEFAVTAQDILWRRSKLGLHLSSDAEQILDAWICRQSLLN